MPPPDPQVQRELTHTRQVRYEGYKRSDGRWDIEAHLTDAKSRDFHLRTGTRRAGEPVHDMRVRLTIDREFNVLEAVASSDAVPYPGGCEQAPAHYHKLVGLNLLKGFRKSVLERLGGVRGCTHITEMLYGMPTAAIQTFAGETKEEREDGKRPFQLDQCIALETSGETVKKWYPRWYAAKTARSA